MRLTLRQPRIQDSGYLPGLDGLRALAILGVLMTHDLPWSIAGHSNADWKGLGGWGVQLFFSISGILITSRILDDERKDGRIRLGSFYLRRFLRIQPAAFAYLLAAAMVALAGLLQPDWPQWFSALFLFINFRFHASELPRAGFVAGHFWTLAVEEHFYLLLSLLLWLFRRHRVAVFALVIAALIAGQHLARRFGFYDTETSSRRTYWVIQLLLVPALLGLLVRVDRIRGATERVLLPAVAIGFTLLLASVHHLRVLAGHPWDGLLSAVANEPDIAYFGFSLLVLAVMLHPRSLTTRFLELAPLRFVGRISYSLYLWHILFYLPPFVPAGQASPLLLALSARPWKYLCTATCALASYYLIERPCIRLGHRIAPPATPGHLDLAVPPAHPGIAPAAG